MKGIVEQIQGHIKNRYIRFTIHAHQKMVTEKVSTVNFLYALGNAHLLEDYPEHERGSCCLVCGFTESNRPLHIVCTTSLPELVIITVYEPRLPKWLTPSQRRFKK